MASPLDNLDQAIRAQAEEVESTVSINPLTGFHLSDLMSSGGKVAAETVRQPLILAKHILSQNSKFIEILSGKKQYEPPGRDRRFEDPAFDNRWLYRTVKQSYLAMCETLDEWIDDLELDTVDRNRAGFLTRLVGESVAPTNTLLGNPAAIRTAIDTRGQSLLRGARNLVRDVVQNHGIPAQVDKEKFEVGKNIASTPGSVVFRNEILELIQYSPTTEKVHERPLLIVSAMINKYYALDLSPDRSMIKFCVDNGVQTFVVSWRNPTREHTHWGLSEYAASVLEAAEAVRSITGSDDLNLLAICSGGMVSAAAFAYQATQDKSIIHSMSVGVCMLSVEPEDQELGAFSSEATFEAVKRRSRKRGILRGHELALAMLWLRPKDLIWGNVVNNYLLGNDPPAFDLLYWNNDWTSLTSELHCDFIDMFWTGDLAKPGGMEVCGTPVDISLIGGDKFVYGGLTDHITPWPACYRSTQVFGGNVEFVLSNSGHMQTMLNSPSKRGASYFVNDALPTTPDEWMNGAELEDGSWWSHWMAWLSNRSGAQIAAPECRGNDQFPALEAAPGTYVFEKAA